MYSSHTVNEMLFVSVHSQLSENSELVLHAVLQNLYLALLSVKVSNEWLGIVMFQTTTLTRPPSYGRSVYIFKLIMIFGAQNLGTLRVFFLKRGKGPGAFQKGKYRGVLLNKGKTVHVYILFPHYNAISLFFLPLNPFTS